MGGSNSSVEIKELSTGIEWNDQTVSDKVDSTENNIADENMDIASAPPHEDYANVEPQAQSGPITPNNTANRRVKRTEVVSCGSKFQCQDCERTFSTIEWVYGTIQSLNMKESGMLVISVTIKQHRRVV